MASSQMNPSQVISFCEHCGFPVKPSADATGVQRIALAAGITERVCNRATLGLGIVGHLEANQTVSFAEAEAIALFHSCVVYALWSSWGKKEPIDAYWSLYAIRFVNKIQERFGDACAKQVNEILKAREAEFMGEFAKTANVGALAAGQNPALAGMASLGPMLALAGKWVRRMRGSYDAASGASAPPTPAALTEIPTNSGLMHLVTSSISADVNLFRAMQPLFQ